MEIVRTKDTGTLQYDIYFNDDQSECVVIERYRDSEASIEHASNLAEVSEAVLARVSVVHGEVLGEPSAELRAKMAGSGDPSTLHALRVDVDTRSPAWARLAGAGPAHASTFTGWKPGHSPRPAQRAISRGLDDQTAPA